MKWSGVPQGVINVFEVHNISRYGYNNIKEYLLDTSEVIICMEYV